MSTNRFSTQGSWVLLVLACVLLAAGCTGAEARKARYLEKAQALVLEQDYQKAELELRNALQIDPNFLAGQLLMADVAEHLGDSRRALQFYQSALDLDGANLTARTGLARIYAFGGLPEKAMELVEAGLAQHPDDPGLLTVRGAAKARLGDTEGALADAEKALGLDPSSENAAALVAASYMSTGRVDDASKLLEAAIERLPRSTDLRLVLASIYAARHQPQAEEAMLRQIVELQPDKLEHRYRLAQFLSSGKRFPEAEQVLREVVSAAPDDMTPKALLVNLLASQQSFEAAEKQLLEFVAAEPKNMKLQIALADFYGARGKTAEAGKVLSEVTRIDGNGPQGLAARNRLAAVALREKRIDDAMRLVEEVLAANAQDNDALIMRAETALGRGDTNAAITDLRSVLRDQPTAVPVLRALARAHLQAGDVALAEETLFKAATAVPGDPQLRVDLAQVHLRNGQVPKAERVLQDAVAESPENLAAQELLFQLQMNAKEFEKARATAESVRSVRPDLPMGDHLVGLVESAEGKTAAAMRAFDAALKLQPGAVEPLTALVTLLRKQNRVDEALVRLDAIVKAQPQNAVARNLQAELLISARRYDAAIASFDAAIGISSGWWIPHRGKAEALLLSGKPDQAIATMQTGLRASGTALPLGQALAELQERLGRFDDAITTYEALLKASPRTESLANNLAMLLAHHRNDPASLERARALAEPFKNSKNAAFLNTYGWTQYRSGNYAEALPPLRLAAELEGKSALMRYHLGMAQLKLGQREDARKSLETALQSGEQFPGADHARIALAQLRQS